MEQIKKAWNKIKRAAGFASCILRCDDQYLLEHEQSDADSPPVRRIRYHGYRHDFRCIDRRN